MSDNQNVLSGFEWQSGFCLHTSWMFGQEKENPRERKINRESEREKSEDLKSASLLITQLCHRMSEYWSGPLSNWDLGGLALHIYFQTFSLSLSLSLSLTFSLPLSVSFSHPLSFSLALSPEHKMGGERRREERRAGEGNASLEASIPSPCVVIPLGQDLRENWKHGVGPKTRNTPLSCHNPPLPPTPPRKPSPPPIRLRPPFGLPLTGCRATLAVMLWRNPAKQPVCENAHGRWPEGQVHSLSGRPPLRAVSQISSEFLAPGGF